MTIGRRGGGSMERGEKTWFRHQKGNIISIGEGIGIERIKERRGGPFHGK